MISNLIYPLRRRWPILVLIPLAALVAAVALTPEQEEDPERWSAGIYLAADTGEMNIVELKQASIDLKQPAVAQRAAAELGEDVDDYKRFAAPLKVSVLEDSLTLRLSVTDPDKIAAEAYVSAFADALIASSTEDLNEDYVAQIQELTDERNVANDALVQFSLENPDPALDSPAAATRRQVLVDRLALAERALADLQATPVEGAFRIQDADETTRVQGSKVELPSSVGVRAVLALMLGLLLAIAVAAFIERLNPRVDRPDDAERIVGAPVLGMVPVMKGKRKEMLERADLSEFSGPFAESFRAMRSHLDFRSGVENLDRPPCVMVVSSVPGEGKTTSAAFLALTYAEVGRDVVVVGGDFRRPAVHRLFGVPRNPGLSTRLLSNEDEGRSEELVAQIVKRDPQTGVRVIPSGPGTDRVTGLLSDLSAVTRVGLDHGYTVVVDTAPVMVANDAIDYLPIVDWVVVVVRLGRTTERALKQTVASLELNDATIAGVIMVGSLEASDAKRYYYSYYKVDEAAEVLAQRQIDEARPQPDADRPPGESLGEAPAAADGAVATATAAPVEPGVDADAAVSESSDDSGGAEGDDRDDRADEDPASS